MAADRRAASVRRQASGQAAVAPGPASGQPAVAPGPPASTLHAFVEELVRAGVRDAVVCPGSRSTPMTLALAAHPAIRLHVHLDERSGSFFALGAAKASRRPVVFLATSGTAVVNAHPAVVEAAHGRVPLVILTADRPPELRDRGAAQTIDQVRLYGVAAKWAVDMPVPEASPAAEAFWRSVASRAAALAAEAPAGPVHVNLPFREPLIPDGDLAPHEVLPPPTPGRVDVEPPARPYLSLVAGRRRLDPGAVETLAVILAAARRPLIACGPLDDPELPAAVAALAAALDAPVLADPLSQVRLGPHDRSRVVAHGDLLVRRGAWIAAHAPDLVVRFGAPPTSKPLGELLAETRPTHVIIDGGDGWLEPNLIPATIVHADPSAMAVDVARVVAELRAGRRPVDPGWCAAWLAADATADRAVRDRLARIDEPYEGRVFDVLGDALPAHALLWVGSSMPIRDLDAYGAGSDRPVRVLANRGANGIDGVVSSALGAAAVHPGPVVLVLGDLSFLHDITALVAARLRALSLAIVLVDNDGGGIFSFLPQARTVAPGVGLPERFEELFGTPHGMGARLGPVVEAFGGRLIDLGDAGRTTAASDDASALRTALDASIGAPGVTVVRYATDRARNVALHREVAAAVAAALHRTAGDLPPSEAAR